MANNVKLSPDQRVFAAGAVKELLMERGDHGASLGEVKSRITSALKIGVFPKSDFGKILFTAKAKKVGDQYYYIFMGPNKPPKVKAPKEPKIANGAEQSISLEGDLTVTVKGSGHDFMSKATKVVVTIGILILAVVVIGLH